MNRRAEQLAGERSLAGFFCKHVLFILCWSLAKIMKGIECLGDETNVISLQDIFKQRSEAF